MQLVTQEPHRDAAYNVVLENADEDPTVVGMELRFGGSTERLADTLSKLLAPYT